MWLYVPFQSALESVASTSDSPSPSQALERSVMWRGKPSRSRVWLQRWSRVPWLRRLSGLTLEPSTAARGVEQWIASLRAFPASPTAQQGSERDTSTNGQSGPPSAESSRSVSPPWCFSKTSLSFSSILSQSEVDYAAWVIELRREYSARAKLARRIGERDSLLWPTAKTITGGAETRSSRALRDSGGEDLEATAMNWPSPRGSDGEKGGPNQRGSHDDLMLPSAAANWKTPQAFSFDQSHLPGQNALSIQAKDWWPTPRTQEGAKRTVEGPTKYHDGDSLTDAIRDWQTPATDSFRSRSGDRRDEMGLDRQARLWATPSAIIANDGETIHSWKARQKRNLAKHVNGNGMGTPLTIQAISHQAQATPPHGSESSPSAPTSRRRLNPKFVLWLMGLLQGLTSFEPVEMESYLCAQRWRLRRLLGVLGSLRGEG